MARSRPNANPYRLFALSNLASMLALVGYPVLLEPWSPMRRQALGWSAGYAVFSALCIAAAGAGARGAPPADPVAASRSTAANSSGDAAARRATPVRSLIWCTLAATSSVLLLAVTNQIRLGHERPAAAAKQMGAARATSGHTR